MMFLPRPIRRENSRITSLRIGVRYLHTMPRLDRNTMTKMVAKAIIASLDHVALLVNAKGESITNRH